MFFLYFTAAVTEKFNLITTGLKTLSNLTRDGPVNNVSRAAVESVGNTVVSDATDLFKLITNAESIFDFINSPMADDLHNKTMDYIDKYSNATLPEYEIIIREMVDENEAIKMGDLIPEWIDLGKQYRLEQYMISIKTTTTQPDSLTTVA